jgi:hypothetical protein
MTTASQQTRLCCAGEDEASMWPTINLLRAHGIRTIIDYAAEDDVPSPAPSSSSTGAAAAQQPSSTGSTTEGSGSNVAGATAGPSSSSSSSGSAPPLRPQQGVVGRTYSYDSEARCDHHVAIFLRAIDTVAKLQDHSFAAIKVGGVEGGGGKWMEVQLWLAGVCAMGQGWCCILQLPAYTYCMHGTSHWSHTVCFG